MYIIIFKYLNVVMKPFIDIIPQLSGSLLVLWQASRGIPDSGKYVGAFIIIMKGTLKVHNLRVIICISDVQCVIYES